MCGVTGAQEEEADAAAKGLTPVVEALDETPRRRVRRSDGAILDDGMDCSSCVV